ncbi:hypothetical protein NDU88_002051 [Pleurodeles waltl]|uniref:Uncharacterized protein n=1 Tax=Pleurodeles waltl TaxID=8319 RepID=A0AAV7W3H5_PLEWA|nr:hypothetical protein NDU88_002051 [Pleurodeles waltl]
MGMVECGLEGWNAGGAATRAMECGRREECGKAVGVELGTHSEWGWWNVASRDGMREVRRLEPWNAGGARSVGRQLEWSWGRTVEVVLRYMEIKAEFNPTLCDVVSV